jgi:hypothetical protein
MNIDKLRNSWETLRARCADRDIVRSFYSRVLWANNKCAGKPNLMRTAFISTPLPNLKVNMQHSHPDAAAERNSMSEFAQSIALATGTTPLFEEMARADQKHGFSGSRRTYWDKDVSIAPQLTRILPNHLLTYVDVDYHAAMDKMLLRHHNTYLLYTIAPEAPAGTLKDAAYRFIDNEIEMTVAGGGQFRHKLWDYGMDCVSVSGFSRWNYRYATYLIERRQVSPSRVVIMLTPIGSFSAIQAVLARFRLTRKTLKRFEPLDCGFNVMNVQRVDGRHVSISRNGSWESVTVSAREDAALMESALLCRGKKIELTKATVESFLSKSRPSPKLDAALLTPYYASRVGINTGPTVYPVEFGVAQVQFKPTEYEQLPATIASYASPLLGPACALDACKSNDERCIQKRVTTKATPTFMPTSHTISCMNSFVNHLVPADRAGTGVPVDEEEVYRKQPRPTQQTILKRADVSGPNYRDIIKSFQKREALDGAGDPRNISTVCGEDKAAESRFIYAISPLLSKEPWYAFGRTPDQIAQRVGDVCEHSDAVLLSDLSRMDGHEASAGRLLTKALLLRYFREVYHEDIIASLDSQHHRSGVSSFGVWFETLWSRLSGSPETSAFNTIVNAFMFYMAYRATKRNGRYLTDAQAWKMLQTSVVVGGDDGVGGDVSKEAYSKACRMMGHVATGDVLQRGAKGVTFLARIYHPDVWYGNVNSCTDIKRAVLKFHTSANLPASVTPLQKMAEKCQSVMKTDSHTPILGDLASAFLRCYNGKAASGDGGWWAQYDLDDQFPNSNDDAWMDDLVHEQIPTYDLGAFRAHINSLRAPGAFLNIPMFMEQPIRPKKHTREVVIDGDVGVEEEKLDFGDALHARQCMPTWTVTTKFEECMGDRAFSEAFLELAAEAASWKITKTPGAVSGPPRAGVETRRSNVAGQAEGRGTAGPLPEVKTNRRRGTRRAKAERGSAGIEMPSLSAGTEKRVSDKLPDRAKPQPARSTKRPPPRKAAGRA